MPTIPTNIMRLVSYTQPEWVTTENPCGIAPPIVANGWEWFFQNGAFGELSVDAGQNRGYASFCLMWATGQHAAGQEPKVGEYISDEGSAPINCTPRGLEDLALLESYIPGLTTALASRITKAHNMGGRVMVYAGSLPLNFFSSTNSVPAKRTRERRLDALIKPWKDAGLGANDYIACDASGACSQGPLIHRGLEVAQRKTVARMFADRVLAAGIKFCTEAHEQIHPELYPWHDGQFAALSGSGPGSLDLNFCRITDLPDGEYMSLPFQDERGVIAIGDWAVDPILAIGGPIPAAAVQYVNETIGISFSYDGYMQIDLEGPSALLDAYADIVSALRAAYPLAKIGPWLREPAVIAAHAAVLAVSNCAYMACYSQAIETDEEAAADATAVMGATRTAMGNLGLSSVELVPELNFEVGFNHPNFPQDETSPPLVTSGNIQARRVALASFESPFFHAIAWYVSCPAAEATRALVIQNYAASLSFSKTATDRWSLAEKPSRARAWLGAGKAWFGTGMGYAVREHFVVLQGSVAPLERRKLVISGSQLGTAVQSIVEISDLPSDWIAGS